MSRRKQSNPARHLDGENDNRSIPIYATEVAHRGSDPDDVNQDGDSARNQNDNEEYLEPVMCANCHQEFCSHWDLLAHEKACCALSVDSAPYDNLNAKVGDGTNGPTSGPGSVDCEEEDMDDQGVSQEELLSRVDGEMIAEEAEEEMDEELEANAHSDPDEYIAVPLSMTTPGMGPGRDRFEFVNAEQGKSEENKENNSGLGNQNDEGEDSMPSNGEVVDNFDPSSMTSLSGMFPGNNVTLEPMAATKAAVAQFPLSQSQMPEDVANTQKALEEWKRKDLYNQQVIQRMQMLLMKQGINVAEYMPDMYNMPPNLGLQPPMDMTAAVMMGSHSVAGYLSTQAEKLQKEEKALKDEDAKEIPKDLSLNIEQVIKQVDRERNKDVSKHKQTPDDSKAPSSTPSLTVPSTPSFLTSLPSASSSPSPSIPASSSPSSSVTPSSLSALSSMTNGSALGLGGSGGGLGSSIKQEGSRSGGSQYSSSSLTALQRETDALKSHILPQLHLPMTAEAYRGYCQRGTVLERSQYACDDPFFKHKCRFCHKVFGSDSALQIHVRSHTGERPFKCNICGNRFSTKGNLKVHFERHKAKYPHIKMNPNPVPESFDRLPPVVAPPMTSSTPIPSSLPLPSGIMPGDGPSPGNPRMMFPPGAGGPGGFFPPGPMMGGGFLSHPFSPRLPAPHLPMMPGNPRCLVSPPPPQSDLQPPSPKASPGDLPRNSHEAARSPSRADGDFGAGSSHGSSEKPSGSRASSPPSIPPPASSASTSSLPAVSAARSEPSTPASSMSAMNSPPIPPLIPAHPPLPGVPHHPPSMPSPHPMARSTPGPIFSNHSLPATPTSFPLPSPLNASFPALMRSHGNPFVPPSPLPVGGDGMFRNSILPTKTIDPSENLEQYMEIQKSETSKLEQLVNNIPEKVREPNQCVICQRVLSCKSALQMHYRIHTGERPFKCKICNRKFTTKGNLKTHMGVHRSKAPMRVIHSCPICHKPFTNVLVLQQHMRQQHGTMPGSPLTPLSVYTHMPAWASKGHLPPGPMLPLPPPPPPKSYEPFDLSRHQEPKELDLSNKRNHLLFGPDRESRSTDGPYPESREGATPDDDEERMDEDVKKEEDTMGEEEMERMMDEDREEEAYNLSRDGGSSGAASHGPHSAFSDNGDSDRPDSNVSAAYGGFDANQPLPPNSDVMDPFLNPSLPPPRGVANPSLAALEDHVKNIEMSVSQSGFERFRNSMGFGASPFLMDKSLSPGVMMPHPNGGNKSPASPRSQGASETGSDGSREESKYPMSDYTMSPLGFSMLGMDMGRGLKNNTTCPTCFKTFACKSALDIHIRSHTKERPYKCDDCDRAFSTRGNLKQHQLTHKPVREPGSDFAEGGHDNGAPDHSADNGSNQDQSYTHESSPQPPHQPDEPQPDSQANNTSSDSSYENSDAGAAACVSPISKASSQAQQQGVTPQQPQTSSSSSSSVGSDPSPSSKNNNNSKSFPDSNSVRRDSPSSGRQSPRDGAMVARKPKHVCDRCLKPFSSASALQIHTRTHTGDKPFKCNVCSKAFTTRGNLKVHMGTHVYNNAPSRRGRRMSIETPLFFAGNPYLAPGFPPGPPRPPPHHDMFFPYPNLMNGMAPARANEIPVIQSVNGGMGHHLPVYPSFSAHPFSNLPAGDEAGRHPADLSLSRSQSDSGVGDRDRRPMDREPSPSPQRYRDRSPSPYRSSSASLPNGAPEMAGTMTSTGELDLSMKPSPTRSSPQKSSPKPTHPPSPRLPYPSPPARMTSSPPRTQLSGDRSTTAASPPPPPPQAPAPPPHATNDNSQENVSSPPPTWVWNTLTCHRCGQSFPSPSALEQHIITHHGNTDAHSSSQPITA